MARIVIECSDIEDDAGYCRYVADRIDEGNHAGTVGWTTDNWSIENE